MSRKISLSTAGAIVLAAALSLSSVPAQASSFPAFGSSSSAVAKDKSNKQPSPSTETPTPKPPVGGKDADEKVVLDKEEEHFIQLLNEYREENGVKPVSVHKELTKCSRYTTQYLGGLVFDVSVSDFRETLKDRPSNPDVWDRYMASFSIDGSGAYLFNAWRTYAETSFRPVSDENALLTPELEFAGFDIRYLPDAGIYVAHLTLEDEGQLPRYGEKGDYDCSM